MKSNIILALNGPLPAQQAATSVTTATLISKDKLASYLSKLWDIDFYASRYDGTGHLRHKLRAIRTLEHTNRFISEIYEVEIR